MRYKILFISGIRSDYDLLKPLADFLKEQSEFEVAFCLCEPHFSSAHDFTFKLVLEDGFDVVNLDLNKKTTFYNDESERVLGIARTIELVNETLALKKPDLVVFLGDREEPLAAAIACAYNKVPTLHIAGGDNCIPDGGDIDEPVRHAISKLSSLHLVIASAHAARLIKMGEPSDRILFVGNPGLDSIRTTPLVSRTAIKGIPKKYLKSNYAVVIYHVMSSVEPNFAQQEFANTLNVLREKQITALIGASNSDPGQRTILNYTTQFLGQYPNAGYFYKNLSRVDFVNMLRHSMFIIGNSSLGVLEAGYLKKPAINVGERQKGRLHENNVVFCDEKAENLTKAVDLVQSPKFQKKMQGENSGLYGDGTMAMKSTKFIRQQLKRTDLLEKHNTY